MSAPWSCAPIELDLVSAHLSLLSPMSLTYVSASPCLFYVCFNDLLMCAFLPLGRGPLEARGCM